MTDISPLTPDERIQAREQAVSWTVAARRSRIAKTSKYPPGVTRTIAVLCLALLLAAFIPSAIRLYWIGSTTFRASMANDYTIAAELVGFAVILSAEIGQVVFSLTLAILTGSRRSRLLLYFGMAVATLIALVGNIQVALPGHYTSVFAWFEAIAPPLLTLSTAYVLKEQMLHAIEHHYAHQRAELEPESDSRFIQYYAEALRQAHLGKRGQVRDARKLSRREWLQLIQREMKEENWFQDLKEEEQPIDENPTPRLPSRNGHGDPVRVHG